MKKQLLFIYCLVTMCFLLITNSLWSQPTLLKDIYPGPESSIQSLRFSKIGNQLVFGANDGVHGIEGWITDGTPSGTMRYDEFTGVLNDTIYTNGGSGLYNTSGNQITYVFANLGFALVNRVTKVNQTWFFVANVGNQNFGELWKSDGTEAGTELVKKFRPNSFLEPYTSNLIAAPNGTDLYFSSNDGTGMALWKSDGTTNGTTKIKIFANTPQNKIGSFINFNNETFFWAYDSSGFHCLWKTNGTEAGTVLVQQKIEGNIVAGNIIVYNNKIYFHGVRQLAPINYGWELWVSDGTDAGTYMFFDINPDIPDNIIAGGSPSGFQIVNNKLLFKANTVLNGNELWITDGTENGTFMLRDVNPGSNSGVISYSSATKELNKLFFTGFDSDQRKLWETDGTVAGTIPLYDISESDLPLFTGTGYINNRLLFMKETIANGKEVWSFNAPSLSTNEVDNKINSKVYPNPVSSILTIETPFAGNYQLKVINQIGQLVLEQSQNGSSTSVDVSNLSKGLYFLTITDKDIVAEVIKFIKN